MNDHDSHPDPVPVKTSFREMMEHLNSPRGDTPEWPLLLRELLQAEFCRQRTSGHCYAGEVFKDRDNEDPTSASAPEKRKVRDLYHACRIKTNGCLHIGDTPYWLLGYEWPNQGREKGRRADLVGLTMDGGLVVFECKVDGNSYGPFAAILEGLDYLACLTSEANFEKIRAGFDRWRVKPANRPPPDFDDTCPDRVRRHEVIVLAPRAYFDLYRRSGRGSGWPEFARSALSETSDPVLIRFAETEYLPAFGIWVTG
jgi:hypothetical protein